MFKKSRNGVKTWTCLLARLIQLPAAHPDDLRDDFDAILQATAASCEGSHPNE